jgi:hypothetical protein
LEVKFGPKDTVSIGLEGNALTFEKGAGIQLDKQ